MNHHNVVDPPAFTGNAAVTPILQRSFKFENCEQAVERLTMLSINPPELPVHAWHPREGIATATADRSVVTATGKRATGNDVLKS